MHGDVILVKHIKLRSQHHHHIKSMGRVRTHRQGLREKVLLTSKFNWIEQLPPFGWVSTSVINLWFRQGRIMCGEIYDISCSAAMNIGFGKQNPPPITQK